MRLFLGIEIPIHIKNFLTQSYGPISLSAKGWELPHDYHLTLLFIGETHQQAEIIQRMQKIKQSPFELKLNTLEFFPRRILYQSFFPSQELMKLKEQIDREFANWRDSHAQVFTPHMTVKRFQRYEYDELKQLINENRFEPKSFTVDKLSLFKSEKDSLNQKYHVISQSLLIDH